MLGTPILDIIQNQDSTNNVLWGEFEELYCNLPSYLNPNKQSLSNYYNTEIKNNHIQLSEYSNIKQIHKFEKKEKPELYIRKQMAISLGYNLLLSLNIDDTENFPHSIVYDLNSKPMILIKY